MSDYGAADWLNWELADAQRAVEKYRREVTDKEWHLNIALGQLKAAIAQVDAIHLIIARSGLEGSAKPADTIEGGK